MNTSSHFAAPHILVLKSDCLYGDLIGNHILSRWPKAKVSVFYRGKDALKYIWQTKPDLFLTGVKLDDMDGLEHLEPFTDSDLPILIVTARADPKTVQLLRRVRYDGLFDTLGDQAERLLEVIQLSLRRQRYISPSVAPIAIDKKGERLKLFRDPIASVSLIGLRLTDSTR